MARADAVDTTARFDTSRLGIIHRQEAVRQASLALVRRLRREARDEITKLIELLDSTDDYVVGELEDDGDQADASYPTSGAHCSSPMEDDEDSDPLEDNHDRENDRCDYEESDTGIADADALALIEMARL